MAHFPLSESGARYNQWLAALKKSELLPRERLIPTLEVETPNEPTPLMTSQTNVNDITRSGVRNLAPWGYSIPLGEGLITGAPQNVERFLFRAHLIANAASKVSNLVGKSVLDMACNHGYFALDFAYRGANATGVDLRTENIAKARLLQNHFKVPAHFEEANVYEISGQYDIVLNLGLLYHVTNPFELMKQTYEMTTELAIIDTITHHSPVSAFIQRTNKDATHHSEGEFDVEFHPTYRGLLDLMHAVGFKGLIEVIPINSPNRATNPLYDRFERRCIIGFK